MRAVGVAKVIDWATRTYVHCANNVTFAAPIVNVDPADLAVPDPFAAVFHPANVYPDRVIDPAPATVTVESITADADDGAFAPPFAL